MFRGEEVRAVDGHRISMTLNMSKKVDPDTYKLSVNLSAEGETKMESADNLQKILNGVIDALSEAGIQQSKIEFGRLDVDPMYKVYFKKLENEEYVPSLYERGREIEGYDSSTELCYTADLNGNINEVETMWRALSKVPGNVDYRIDFDIKDRPTAKKELAIEGIRTARERALLFAEASGCGLGPVAYIKVEEEHHVTYRRKSEPPEYRESSFPLFAPTPVEIRAQALVEWELV